MLRAAIEIIRILPILFTLIGQIRNTFRGREEAPVEKESTETPKTEAPLPPKPEEIEKKLKVERIKVATKDSRMEELLEIFKKDHEAWVKSNG